MDSKVIKVRFEDETRKFRVNKLSVIFCSGLKGRGPFWLLNPPV